MSHTAHKLIQSMLQAEGRPSRAVQALHAQGKGKLRTETVLDAARGLFASRSEAQGGTSWALRLCDYALSAEEGFQPRWRLLALKTDFHFARDEIEQARKSYDLLAEMGDESFEAGIVAQRLYQRLCQNERFWEL